MSDIGQNKSHKNMRTSASSADLDSFVLDKGIFSNIFEKDIRRVYIYKKAERLAKALYLIAPAFRGSVSLKDRVQRISLELVNASILPPVEARDALSRELLALSSVLSIARTANLLSVMNAEIIAREAQHLLRDIAVYEEPKLAFDETPTLASLAKSSAALAPSARSLPTPRMSDSPRQPANNPHSQGQNGNGNGKAGRRSAILSVLATKGPLYIKDISTVIREVSEKTIQRELQALVLEGKVSKEGERRWTRYTLVR